MTTNQSGMKASINAASAAKNVSSPLRVETVFAPATQDALKERQYETKNQSGLFDRTGTRSNLAENRRLVLSPAHLAMRAPMIL